MKRKILILTLVCLLILLVLFFLFPRKRNEDEIILFGNVDVRQVDLGFRVKGRIISMPYQEGDFVPQGALMASLEEQPYGDQVKEAQSVMVAAKRTFENAEQLLKRRLELVGQGGVSQEDLQNTQSNYDVSKANFHQSEASLLVALKNLEDTKVYCPNDGTILTRIREPGTVVLESEPAYTLSLISPVWIRAFISEPFLGRIYPGMPADIHTDTKGGEVYKGHIGFISPIAEFTPKTVETTQLRTDLVYRLRVIADNPNWGLRQGMPVTVKLHPKQTQARK